MLPWALHRDCERRELFVASTTASNLRHATGKVSLPRQDFLPWTRLLILPLSCSNSDQGNVSASVGIRKQVWSVA